MNPMLETQADRLKAKVFADRSEMGAFAAKEAAGHIRALLEKQERVRIVFAAASSQNECLAALCREPGIDWTRIEAFHMDEYIGLPEGAPQTFAAYLKRHLFDRVRPGRVELIDGGNSIEAECGRYAHLIAEAPIDVVCLGIGENGHIAFNDPPVADFRDPLLVKAVELDAACRQQQVNDGCFPTLRDVPTHAITLTIPALFAGARLFCVVPGASKRQAVRRTLGGPVSTTCPASILRTHPDCTLYADQASYGDGIWG